MGQTILDEYLAAWDETLEQPDPTKFGFNDLYTMLVEAQEAMLSLGMAANKARRDLHALRVEYNSTQAVLEFADAKLIEFDHIISEQRKEIEELRQSRISEEDMYPIGIYNPEDDLANAEHVTDEQMIIAYKAKVDASICPVCHKHLPLLCRRLPTQYADDASNWLTSCYQCFEIACKEYDELIKETQFV